MTALKQIMRRAGNKKFPELLNRLRKGNPTNEAL